MIGGFDHFITDLAPTGFMRLEARTVIHPPEVTNKSEFHGCRLSGLGRII
jgi:hypothetical protein